MTSDGLPYEPPRTVKVWPAGVLIVLGALGLWFANAYKPSPTNDVGLNGNQLVLSPTTYHTIQVASIIVLVVGVIRLLVAIGRLAGRR